MADAECHLGWKAELLEMKMARQLQTGCLKTSSADGVALQRLSRTMVVLTSQQKAGFSRSMELRELKFPLIIPRRMERLKDRIGMYVKCCIRQQTKILLSGIGSFTM